MIDHIWTVLCSRAVVDRESNNVSIQNVIEQVTIAEEPKPDGMFSGKMNIVTLWARADFNVPSCGRSRLSFLFPSGEVIQITELDIDLSEFKRGRTIMKLLGFPAKEPGRHTFCVELQNEGETEWHQVAAIPLEVNFVPPEETEQAESPL